MAQGTPSDTTRLKTRRGLLEGALLVGGAAALASPALAQPAGTDEAFYEWRFYRIQQGRMADMHARMRDGLRPLFVRHGLRLQGCWETGSPNQPVFAYLLQWPSWRARLEAWGGFYADPDWVALAERTNHGSDLVEAVSLTMATPVGAVRPVPEGKVCELIEAPVQFRKREAFIAALPEMAARTRATGGELLGVFDPPFGDDLPKMLLLAAGRGFDMSQLDATAKGPATRRILAPAPYGVR